MHTENCPYCKAVCEADWVDVGVGWVQCGPFHCMDCGATEAGAYDSEEDQRRKDPKTGWYRPGEMPGSSANVINGKVVSAVRMKEEYRQAFTGNPMYEVPGAVEAWFEEKRQRAG